MADMGMDDWLLNKLIPTDTTDPIHIWNAPKRADAVPAFFSNGAKANADVFGLVMPTQHNTKNIMAMVPTSPRMFCTDPTTNKTEIITIPISATLTICALLYRFTKKLFTWLEPIKPTERIAKIHP